MLNAQKSLSMSIIGTASEEIKYGTLIEHQKEKENDDRYGKLVEKYKR